MTPYHTIVTAMTVKQTQDTVNAESATTITVINEGGGYFLELSQCLEAENRVRICAEEWDAVKATMEIMLAICVHENAKEARPYVDSTATD